MKFNKKMNELKKLLVLMMTFFVSVSFLYAVTTPSGGVTTVGDSGTYTASTAGNASAVGGNVTSVNIASSISTTKWQGFYGNVTGNQRLGSGANVFYDFGSTTFTTVFATTGTSIAWASLEAGNIVSLDGNWSFNTASDVDQAVDIFGTLNETYLSIASVPKLAISSNFSMYVFNDGGNVDKGDYVFAAAVSSAGAAGFDGKIWNYELMVPVGGSAETYYFYAALQ